MSSATTLSADLLVIAALKAGLQALVDNEALFLSLLAAYPADERARIRTRFLARTPTVQPAFARTSDPWPLWSVVLADRSPTDLFLGHRIGVAADIGTNGSRQFGYVGSQSVQIYLHTEHPAETRIHDLLCEACLFGQVGWLLGQGATSVIPGGARDLRPDETYLPETVFSRVQTWDLGGLTVAYEALPAPHTTIYAHITGITVDGIPGQVDPVGQ